MGNLEESNSISIGNHFPLSGGSDESSKAHLEVCKMHRWKFPLDG